MYMGAACGVWGVGFGACACPLALGPSSSSLPWVPRLLPSWQAPLLPPGLFVAPPPPLRERNKKRHGKARTSSKGERGSKGKDKQKARKLTHFIRRCVLRVTEQSTTSRIAKQTSQITSEKHEVRRRTKQSTSTNETKHDVVEAKHDVIKAKHGVRLRSKARRLSCLNLRKAFFSVKIRPRSDLPV